MSRGEYAKNREFWELTSDEYQQAHGPALARAPVAWGVWRIPESELQVLGELAGSRVLELGCGAAQWSCALAERGVHPVGMDLSARQLAHARAHARGAAVSVPLVRAHADAVPFRDGSFDVVFCDHGAMTFAAPASAVPEAARVLRAGGLFAFCMSTPLRDICAHPRTFETTTTLHGEYFALGALDDGETVNAQLPYGAWIRLFRASGLRVEDLIELRAPAGATTSYGDYVPVSWASRWPAEHIWKLRKEG